MINLKGNIVVVTGASGGIGSGIARRFAAAGASLILHYHSNSESVTKLAEELPVKAIPVQANIVEEGSAERIVDVAVGEFGKIDILN